VFPNTGHNLDAILWTGSQFLYVENTANTIWAAPGAGVPRHRFAGRPRLVEETRRVISPWPNSYPPTVIFCHSPDDKIYEIGADGSRVTVSATLPVPASTTVDGALAVDTVGRFDHQLVAATGRSGAKEPQGGAAYTISGGGVVKEVGGYSGPGADEVVTAPSGLGSAAAEALLTLDGGERTLARVPRRRPTGDRRPAGGPLSRCVHARRAPPDTGAVVLGRSAVLFDGAEATG
jgi:hypothetical protein